MRLLSLVVVTVLASSFVSSAQPAKPESWKARVSQVMPLLGHRNWILVVDSAYPLQTSNGIETIETDESQVDVVRWVLGSIHSSVHVRPVIYMDAELPFVPDQDAQGISAYRAEVGSLLQGYEISSLPHEKIIASMDETAKAFHILVLKTNTTMPYTSVFIRLDCKYWSAHAEERLRARMKTGSAK